MAEGGSNVPSQARLLSRRSAPIFRVCACDQRLPAAPTRLMAMETLRGIAVEKLAVDRGQFGFLADSPPLFCNRRDLLFNQRGGFCLFQVAIRRCRKARWQFLAIDNPLVSFACRTWK